MLVKKTLLILIAFLAAGFAPAQPPSPPAEASSSISFGVGWINSYPDAVKLSKAMKSPLLMVFTAEWCPPCRMMHDQTYPDPRIQALLKRIACLRVDVDANHELAMTWRVAGIPRLIVLNVAGQVLADHIGFMSADKLEPVLQDALARANDILPEAPESPAQPSPVREQRITAQLAAARGDGLTSAAVELFLLPKPEMREKGLEQLVRGGERVKPVLLGLLGDERLAVRALALDTLEKLGESNLGFDPWAGRKERTAALNRLLAARRARPAAPSRVKAPQ